MAAAKTGIIPINSSPFGNFNVMLSGITGISSKK